MTGRAPRAVPAELAAPVPTGDRPVMLSWGLGKHSSSILLNWVTDPASRDFDLDQLVVVHAVTGDEFPDSLRVAEQHILPRLADAGVRLVQIARAGFSQRDGIAVLSDTRRPHRLFRSGPVRLSAELMLAGTVPQVARNRRSCTHKWKGWPLDTWSARELGRDYVHVLGFHYGEAGRALRDHSYTTNARIPAYPLLTWGWNDQHAQQFLQDTTGIDRPWPASYCVFCPFLACTGTRAAHLARLREHPLLAAEALLIEYTAMALNPLAMLYGSTSLLRHLTEDGNTAALTHFAALLHDTPWALYHVRRSMRGADDNPWRRISSARALKALRTGTREEMAGALHDAARRYGQPVDDTDGHSRLWLRHRRTGLFGRNRRERTLYPSVEQLIVAAPAIARDKQSTTFDQRWTDALAVLAQHDNTDGPSTAGRIITA